MALDGVLLLSLPIQNLEFMIEVVEGDLPPGPPAQATLAGDVLTITVYEGAKKREVANPINRAVTEALGPFTQNGAETT